MRAGQCSLICACALFFIVFVSSVDTFEQDGTYYYDELGGVYYQPQIRQDENVRGKRTLGIFLKSFADAIGYDVQKRPSALPIGGAPVAAAPAAMAPVPAAPVPAAPAPGKPGAAALPLPGKPGAAAPPPPGKPGAAAPPPPAPKAPLPAPAAPPAKPAPAAAPALPPMPAAPAAAPKPAAPRPPTAPPLLTETIQKMFNINFNWNRNLQPKIPAAPAPPAPAPKAPPAAPPAAPAPNPPLAAPPAAPPAPPAAPPAPPAAPSPKGPPTKAPPTKYYQDLQENDYLDYPDRQQQIIYYPDENESLNQEDTKEVRNDYGFPEAIQQYWTQSPWNKNNIQYNIYTPAPDYQEFNTPDGGRGYHVRHYHRNDHLQHQDQPNEQQKPEQQQQAPESNEQEQYQQQPEQQEQYQQQPEQQEQYQQQPEQQEQYQQQPEQQEQFQHQQQQQEQYEKNNEDVNGDDSKSYYKYNNNDYQPRGFQPVYSGSESRYQNNYFQPGLPLQIHGIEKDKVLVAWPAPFELAGSEKKNKIAPYNNKQFGDKIQSSASENQEYKYEPESYGEYNFYTIPPPTKYQYENYDAPSDPKVEKELSENAKVSETNYSKKYTNVNVDRNTYVH